MVTFKALIGTVVKNSSVAVKFDEVLYNTDKKEEIELLESSDLVEIYGAKVEKKQEVKESKKAKELK